MKRKRKLQLEEPTFRKPAKARKKISDMEPGEALRKGRRDANIMLRWIEQRRTASKHFPEVGDFVEWEGETYVWTDQGFEEVNEAGDRITDALAVKYPFTGFIDSMRAMTRAAAASGQSIASFAEAWDNLGTQMRRESEERQIVGRTQRDNGHTHTFRI